MLKLNHQEDYLRLVKESANECREVIDKITESALSKIGITDQDYNNSFGELLKEPTAVELI